MAEGVTRLGHQVVETGGWTRSPPPHDIDPSPLCMHPTLLDRERRREDVRRAVEVDVIPRVLPHEPRSDAARSGIADDEVIAFAEMLLAHADEDSVQHRLGAVQARGVALDDIYIHLFQPVARYIGDLWADDACSFVDVTLAVATLQKMLRVFEPIFQKNGRPGDGDRRALLVPLPGDQHTFGLSMVSEFFRRAGWSVWTTPLASIDELGHAVCSAWFSIVGFSVSAESRFEELAAAIRLVRLQSCNRGIGVLVGGPLFVDRPDYALRVGADAMGRDAHDALARAETFAGSAAGL